MWIGLGSVRATRRNGRPLIVIDGTLAASEPPTATHNIERGRHHERSAVFMRSPALASPFDLVRIDTYIDSGRGGLSPRSSCPRRLMQARSHWWVWDERRGERSMLACMPLAASHLWGTTTTACESAKKETTRPLFIFSSSAPSPRLLGAGRCCLLEPLACALIDRSNRSNRSKTPSMH